MIKKITYGLGGFALATMPIAGVVSCGSSSDTSSSKNINGNIPKIKVAYEKSWKPVIDDALSKMKETERGAFELKEIDDSKSSQYLDIISTKSNDKKTADLFPMPLDRISGFVTSNVLAEIKKQYFDSNDYSDENTMGVIDGKRYVYPLNVETITQIYHISEKPNGFSTIEEAFKDDSFITQWNNLWYGSAYMNSALVGNGTPTDFAKKWITKTEENGKTKYSYPFLKNKNFETAFKTLYNQNKKLRDSKVDWKVNIANGDGRTNYLEEHFTSENKDISGMIDGPWIINDLIGKIIDKNKDENVISSKLDDIGVSIMPSLNGSPLRHFKGGWGYGINKIKIINMSDTAKQLKKFELENKFLKLLTSKDEAKNWFTAGGKISVAKDANLKITNEDIKKMKLKGVDGKDISLEKYGDKLTTSISSLYKRVVDAVQNQSKSNVIQPSGPAFDLWDAWDKLVFSNPSITNADDAWNKFIDDCNNVLSIANKD
ncbi:MAG: extracellular solute-binding protein [Mycoplasmatales bacterium]|nr:extracellular solute-binding protein [Mycoplasmatales bacterium]